MTRETKSYELKIYDQSLMRFEAAYDAFGSLKLEITDIDSANAHLLPFPAPYSYGRQCCDSLCYLRIHHFVWHM